VLRAALAGSRVQSRQLATTGSLHWPDPSPAGTSSAWAVAVDVLEITKQISQYKSTTTEAEEEAEAEAAGCLFRTCKGPFKTASHTVLSALLAADVSNCALIMAEVPMCGWEKGDLWLPQLQGLIGCCERVRRGNKFS